jgi:methyl-accepting chemotaxis protein
MTTLSSGRRRTRGPQPSPVPAPKVSLRRRRNYLIDPGTQLAITRQFVVVFIAAYSLSVGNYHVIRNMLSVEVQDGFSMTLAYGYAGTMVAISLGLLFLLCLFFSHRIAGPAFRIAGALDRMAGGDLCVKVTLRDADLLNELASSFNTATQDLRTALGEVETELQRARRLADGNSQLDACLRRAEQALAGFTIRTSSELPPRQMR